LSFLDENKTYDFTVCNPPFFNDESEAVGRSDKIRNPTKRHKANSKNTAQLDESVYDQGGEVEFIKKMIDESVLIENKIKYNIFTY
jgi:23S rRNA (adenine1618-N6)-methyltransferase